MDSLTHIVLGATIGDALLGRRFGKKAMLYGALASSLPDIDVLGTLFMKPANAMLFHRGITHSIFFVVIMSFLLGWLLKKLYSGKDISYKEWTLFVAVNMFSHIVLDAFTSYGTGWFEPFSHYRVSFHTIFVADPLYTLPLLISTIVLLIMKTDSSYRKFWRRTGIILSTMYLCLTVFNKLYVDKAFTNALHAQHITYTRYLTNPTPLNNELWSIFAQDSTGYWTGYYSVLDNNDSIHFRHIEQHKDWIKGGADNHILQEMITFSENYYCITRQDSDYYFNDLRFGQIGAWYDPKAPYVFSFKLTHGDNAMMSLQKGRFRMANNATFSGMWRRIMGHKQPAI